MSILDICKYWPKTLHNVCILYRVQTVWDLMLTPGGRHKLWSSRTSLEHLWSPQLILLMPGTLWIHSDCHKLIYICLGICFLPVVQYYFMNFGSTKTVICLWFAECVSARFHTAVYSLTLTILNSWGNVLVWNDKLQLCWRLWHHLDDLFYLYLLHHYEVILPILSGQ